MPTLTITLSATLDGQPIPGLPYIHTVTAAEAQTFTPVTKAGDEDAVTFTTLPTTAIATMTALLITTDQPLTLRLNAQSDAGITLQAGGCLLLSDCTLDAGTTTNATANLDAAATVLATLRGLALGTNP